MSTVITSQPRAQNPPEHEIEGTNTTMLDQEEIEARKQQNENLDNIAETCCCVLESTEDMWCLCHCIASCFRGLGHCTDTCCEDCAQCISSCCENSGETSGPTDNCCDCCDTDCFCCDCDCSD